MDVLLLILAHIVTLAGQEVPALQCHVQSQNAKPVQLLMCVEPVKVDILVNNAILWNATSTDVMSAQILINAVTVKLDTQEFSVKQFSAQPAIAKQDVHLLMFVQTATQDGQEAVVQLRKPMKQKTLIVRKQFPTVRLVPQTLNVKAVNPDTREMLATKQVATLTFRIVNLAVRQTPIFAINAIKAFSGKSASLTNAN